MRIEKRRYYNMTIAVVIPAYNEELTIKEVIIDFHNAAKDADIYVIDNNSSDKTGEIARKALKSISNKGGIIFEKKQGKANAVRTAFATIEADIYVLVDADLTYPARELPKLLEPVLSGQADMCVGDRLSGGDYSRENKRCFHNIGNNVVTGLINLLFKSGLNDIMSGYRVFNRRFVKNLPILCDGFELETEMTLHALDKKYSIVEIPVEYRDRVEGSFSKLNTYTDGFRVLKTIFGIFKDYRPMLFFGICALVFFIAGLAAGFPVILEFYLTRYVKHVPLALLATGCMIFAMLLLSVGLILDTMVKHFRLLYIQNLTNFSGKK